MRGCGLFALALVVLIPAISAAKDTPTPAGVQFFEAKVRPVLLKHCYSCHSVEAKKSRGGLRVDSRAALLKGGDSGPAIVPGKPLASLFIKAVRHDGIEMPPNNKLSAAVIADLEKWIAMGAPDPRDGKSVATTAIDLTKGRKFWSFQPPRRHAPPAVKNAEWPLSSIDNFILAALEAKNLRPARDADRITLLRRVTLALTGLPPTPEEIDAFSKDTRADAYSRLVDRLLASPAFGERWGRHWLDVVRYADSNGKDENLTFHEAWLFRDYIIRSFNHDRPFNQLVREHIAGDLLPSSTAAQREEQLTGTGFLVLGPKVLADRDQVRRKMDVVDEQIDTIGKTFLGLTLGCARCHDHKFDPVPAADYYALAGILASTRTLDSFKRGNPIVSGWMVRPIDEAGEKQLTTLKAHQAKLKKVSDQLKKVRAELKSAEDRATMRVPGKLIGIVVDDRQAKLTGAWKPSTFSRPYVGTGYIHDNRTGKGDKSAVFTPKLPRAGQYEVLISYTPGGNRADNIPIVIAHADGEKKLTLNQRQKPTIDGLFRSIGTYRFVAGEKGSVTITNRATNGYVIVDAVRFVPSGALAKDPEMAMGVPSMVKEQIAAAKERISALETEESKLKRSAPPAPRLVMAVRDDVIADAKIAIRGNPHQLGESVPRGVLSVASDDPRPRIAKDQSGRLELAKWLAHRSNPLTARVMVNRVWMHLLGEGLVRTVDNFGAQGERPSHPELLDTLAVEFMDSGWSLKSLVRSIVLSRTYRMAVVRDPKAYRIDPANRLLWSARRSRLQAEVIRDSMMQASGTLDRRLGGSSVAHLGEGAVENNSKGVRLTEGGRRRSVYLPVIRNELVPIFDVFDFADPDVTVGRRDTTTVATQALYLLNSPFVREQAKAAAQRLMSSAKDNKARVELLYRQTLSRAPTAEETRKVLAYIRECGDSEAQAWESVCQAVFGCTEFRFVE